MHAAVANHGELARPRCQKDQHGIAFTGFLHAEPGELLLRRRHGVGHFCVVADENPHLAGGLLFRRANSGNDFGFAQLLKE